MPLFSIKRGPLPNAAQWFKLSPSLCAVYLNVLAVVVLAEPTEPFYNDTSPDVEFPYGVEVHPFLPEVQLEEVVVLKDECVEGEQERDK